MTNKKLKTTTEKFTGKNTVKSVMTCGFLMVEMANEALALKVANVWNKMEKAEVSISGTKVYAFPN